MELKPGHRFGGRYEIEGELGAGGMGTVYAAKHAFTGRAVALKVLHEDLGRLPDSARERFLREAQAPNRIRHPSLVEVLDAGEDDDRLYLVMERLEGMDLARALESGALDDDTLVQIVIELLDALAAAHAAGVVHRDIKPENVFVLREAEPGARIKLLDFGITRLVEADEPGSNLTRTGTILGTPLYMSPEQARGEPVDARTDLWSVGAILYEGLSGRPHFSAPNYNMLIAKILTETPAPLSRSRPGLPAPLVNVVERALSRKESRWQSASEMRDALALCLSVSEAVTRPPRRVSSRTAELSPDAPEVISFAETVAAPESAAPRRSSPSTPSTHPPTRASAPTPIQGAHDPADALPAIAVRRPRRARRYAALGATAVAIVAMIAFSTLWQVSRPNPPEPPPQTATEPPGEGLVPIAPEPITDDERRAEPELDDTTAEDDAEEVEDAVEEAPPEPRPRPIRRRRRPQPTPAAASQAHGRCVAECNMAYQRCVIEHQGDSRAILERCETPRPRCLNACPP